ncbi:MAG: M48 family metallopeptidase [Bryobacterales bacterium]|nr:M48 family metallopeptidase [Acidobacteriota bacterium]MCB9383229.1 M48 family metallopeptidase [Bryobacterales bacterium]
MTQLALEFEVAESPEEMFARVFRTMKPRTAPPSFRVLFKPYANLDSKIRLEAGHEKIEVRMSDQLRSAPHAVREALAWVLLGKLYRKAIPPEIERDYKLFVNRADVRRRALELRRERGHKRLVHPKGGVFDLEAMFEDLNVRFFEGALSKPALGWSPKPSRRLLGHYDPAHHAIVISSIFDTPKTPRYAVEYVLYHEMLHIKHPAEYRTERRCVHTPAFRAEEKLFPQYAEALKYLKRF